MKSIVITLIVIFIAIPPLFGLWSCTVKTPLEVEEAKTQNQPVLLCTKGAVKIYRYNDGGIYIYFTNYGTVSAIK